MKEIGSIKVRKFPCALEEVVDIIIQLIGLTIIYLLFTEIGERVIGEEFSKDILLSMVVLPAILVLKQASNVFQPYFVEVDLQGNTLSVKQGILTTFEDSLNLDTVENVETVTTIIGRLLNYSTIRIYAYGSWVEVPNIQNPEGLKQRLNDIIKSKKSDVNA